jgi:hypothetical protein
MNWKKFNKIWQENLNICHMHGVILFLHWFLKVEVPSHVECINPFHESVQIEIKLFIEHIDGEELLIHHEHQLLCLFRKESLEPMGWKLRVFFQSVFIVYVVDAKLNCVIWVPFEVVQQWPCKVSFNVYTFPVPKTKTSQSHQDLRARESYC